MRLARSQHYTKVSRVFIRLYIKRLFSKPGTDETICQTLVENQ